MIVTRPEAPAPDGAVMSWVEPHGGRWNRWRYQVWVRMESEWQLLSLGRSRWRYQIEVKLGRAQDVAFLYSQRHYGKFA